MLFLATAGQWQVLLCLNYRTKQNTDWSNYTDFWCFTFQFGGWNFVLIPRGDGTEFWAPMSLGGKLADICLMRIIAYSG